MRKVTLFAVAFLALVGCKPRYEPMITKVSLEEDALANQVRIITSWTIPTGAAYDSVRVQVVFGAEGPVNKLKAGTATKDTTVFSIAGVPAGGGVGGNVTVQGFRRTLPGPAVNTEFNFIRSDVAPPAVTGVTVGTDTTGL